MVALRWVRAAIVVASAGAFILGTAGCGTSAPEAEETEQTDTVVEEATVEPSPTPTGPSTNSEQFSEGAAVADVGPKVVIVKDTSSGESAYRLYGPGTETGGTVTPATQQGTAELLGGWPLAQGAPDGNAQMAYLTFSREPNDGLKAGGYVLTTKTYDINGTPLNTVSTPTFENFDLSEASFIDDTVYIRSHGMTEHNYKFFLDAIDANTGARKWTAACGQGYAGTSAIYATPTTVAAACDLDGVNGFDTATGNVVWSYEGGTTQSFWYDRSAPGVLSAWEYAGESDVTIDLVNGTLINEDAQRPVLGDPLTGKQTYSQLTVYDPAQQKVTFSIPQEQIEQLGDFTPLSTFDGRLTFIASDGLSVVSTEDGATDPSSPPKSASQQGYTSVVADAGDGWVLMGSISSSWDPDSWAMNNYPVQTTWILWATNPDGALSWDDIPKPATN